MLCYCLARHAATGFGFAEVNKALVPFFRNHVAYAAIVTIVLPLLVLAAVQYRRRGKLWLSLWFIFTSALCLLAVQTSYTRAAYVSLFLGLVSWPFVHYRLWRFALPAGLAAALLGVVYLAHQNRFFDFAPEYTKAIVHKDFGNLVEATYQLEDASTMERAYRWVAGGYMVGERPYLGYGPSSFYTFYKGYALEAFRTYVSENPERSTTHNYFLMTAAEQGIPGLLFFLLLVVAALLSAERSYRRSRSPAARLLIVGACASLVINLGFQLINDMIETDKAGSWFFLSLALLVLADRSEWQRESISASSPS